MIVPFLTPRPLVFDRRIFPELDLPVLVSCLLAVDPRAHDEIDWAFDGGVQSREISGGVAAPGIIPT